MMCLIFIKFLFKSILFVIIVHYSFTSLLQWLPVEQCLTYKSPSQFLITNMYQYCVLKLSSP